MYAFKVYINYPVSLHQSPAICSLGHQAKLFVCILSVENKIDAFQSATLAYQVLDELKTNINNYAVAVLLSVNISAYKGDIPHNHITFYSLTQSQVRVKKLIQDSITQNTNVFTLAQHAIHQECNGGKKYWNLIDQCLALAARAFRDILKTDRDTYGMGEDYEIGDVVADDWQQRVNDVVAGI
ncbi:hypothetical protein BYT27DRAFT_7224926 [Phlegmacium glaucopus]|nr:hypothetical protein BYT27DRAFT_7224926 [Phlegmacium glaucopus]